MGLLHRSISMCLLAMLSTLSYGALVKDGRNDEIKALKMSLDNAFDALKEVHKVLEQLDKDTTEQQNVKRNSAQVKNKKVAVDEINQVENIAMNKKKSVKQLAGKSNQKEKYAFRKDSSLEEEVKKAKFDATKSKISREMSPLSNEDMKESIDFLIDILKDGHKDAKGTKLRDYLISVFEKEDSHLNSQNDAHAQTAKANIEVEDAKKEVTGSEGKEDKRIESGGIKDVKYLPGEVKKPLSKSTAEKIPPKEVVLESTIASRVINAKNDDEKATNGDIIKKDSLDITKKGLAASQKINDDIQELVDVILKRKEELKREKVKLAVADLFQMIVKKQDKLEKKEE